MEIRLYNNRSAPQVFDKSLTLLRTEEGQPYDVVNIEEPTFILSDVTLTNLNSLNYAYVPELERWYFARVSLMSNGIYAVSCQVDPIQSFKPDILNSVCIISRAEDESLLNRDINDGSYVTEANNFMAWKTFPTTMNDPVNILICAGGV